MKHQGQVVLVLVAVKSTSTVLLKSKIKIYFDRLKHIAASSYLTVNEYLNLT